MGVWRPCRGSVVARATQVLMKQIFLPGERVEKRASVVHGRQQTFEEYPVSLSTFIAHRRAMVGHV